MASTDNSFLKSALAYATRLSWPVFPLETRGKNPLTSHGFKDASTDEKQIRSWWKRYPKANIGVPTGRMFWVLDVDPRNGGSESLEVLINRNSGLPDTIQQMTGGGGRHFLFALDPQHKVGCGTLTAGIDYKGVGGYIVVAPSIHPCGRAYTWDGVTRITEQKLLPASSWLIAQILQESQPNGAKRAVIPDRIRKGSQHHTLFKMGCAMRAQGFGEPEILAALWEANQNRCEEPGPRENIEKLAHSICAKYPAGFDRKNPPAAEKKTPANLAPRDSLEIYYADYPDPLPLIEPILYPGLTLFAGRPKVGKSWLAMQLAIAFVSGAKFCDYLEVKKPGRCLYLSLEERPRQTRSRLRKLTPPNDFLADLKYIYDIPALMAEGAVLLDQELAEHPAELVIVDSLLGITQQAGRKGMDLMQTDYNIVRTLRQIAEKHALTMIVIAHTRKAPGDFVDSIQGTTGTTAAADAIWVLTRTPEGRLALSVTGREVSPNIFGLERQGDLPALKISGEGDEVTQSEERREILELLREQGPMKVLAIGRAMHKNVGAIQRLLTKLRDTGLIVRTRYGTYQIVGVSGSTGSSGSSGSNDPNG